MKTIRTGLLILICILFHLSAEPFYVNALFVQGSASPASPKQLAEAIERLKYLTPEMMEKQNLSLIITGYIDQSGSEKNDTTLALRRAQEAAKFVKSITKIPENRIVVRGTSGHSYHILTVTAEGRRLNRRAEITLQKMQQKDTPLILNIVEMGNASLAHTDSASVKDGGTITVGAGGFARLALGTRTSIDLDENSTLSVLGKKIVLHSGRAQINRTGSDETAPLFYALRSDIVLTGNGVLALDRQNTLLVSVLTGTAQVSSPYGKKTASAAEGIAVLNSSSKIHHTKLPTAPSAQIPDSVSLIPGTKTSASWNRSGETFRFQMSRSSSFQTAAVDQSVTDTSIQFAGEPGVWYIRIQAENAPGFRSLWSTPQSVAITKKESVKLNAPFSDTLFAVSPTRPFTVSGTADKAVRLFLDTAELSCGSSGEFSRRIMLGDDITVLPFISLNPDGSRDTLEAKVLYTGADELITMNDSILGREAFTTSRSYTLRGSMPTAKSLKINGEPIALDENRHFQKKFKTPTFEKFPVELEVSFENGHTKTIKRSIERIEHDTPIQRGFFTFLGLAAVAGLFAGIAAQTPH